MLCANVHLSDVVRLTGGVAGKPEERLQRLFAFVRRLFRECRKEDSLRRHAVKDDIKRAPEQDARFAGTRTGG